MYQKLFGATVLGAMVLSTGCAGINGKWDLATVEPTAAQRDVEYRSLRLDKDGSFYGEATESSGIKTTSGTYSYADGILHLKPHDGEDYTYDAQLESSGQELKLSRHWQGTKMKLKYERRSGE